ncbi:hypothetical protein FDECE_2665 [Fusarium decemcellulare]|nr:hypothetical protein FDECE_2665 [Fusarium decemcellulare]
MASKYAATHISPQGPGDARPRALQILQDEGLEEKLTGKVIFITGCSSGIGIETVRTLSKTGATVYATARDLPKAKAALGDLVEQGRVHILALDLNSLGSVRACVAQFFLQSKTLNILINNAGVMVTPEGRTADGIETQFGTNHVAHFLLFQLLKPALLSSSTSTFPSRVVMVASSGHRASEVHFENVNLEGEYHPWTAYGQSKTAMVWTANEIERRYGPRGLHAYSLHPGAIATGLQKHVTKELQEQWSTTKDLHKLFKSMEQGAATTVWAALAKELEGSGGKYLEDCQIIGPWDPATGLTGTGYAPWAYDETKAAKLWELSLELVGLEENE